MNDYKKVIIAVIVIIIIAGGLFWFFGSKESLTEVEKDAIAFLEDNVLTEDQQGRLNQALSDLKEDPKDVGALISIARIKQQAGDFNGAEETYLDALEIQPGNTVILNNLGDIYIGQSRWEDAERTFLALIAKTPKWISSYRELGDIYRFHIEEKYPEMEQILLTAIEVTADITEYAPVDLYIMLGSFYRRTNDVQNAIKYFEITLKLMPENTAVQRELELLKN